MGYQLTWQERFNIGVDYIDKEHQKLFGIMSKMIRFGEQPEKHQWICDEGIRRLGENGQGEIPGADFSGDFVPVLSLRQAGQAVGGDLSGQRSWKNL